MYDFFVTNCELYCYCSTSSISANVNKIPILNGTNFKKWKEHVMIVLGCMDLDYALRKDHPADLTDASTTKQRAIMEGSDPIT